MESKKVGDGYVARLVRGEELSGSMLVFCMEKKIVSGWVQGLGATEQATIAYYDLAKKEYVTKEFSERLEVANLVGNISQRDGKTVLHIHATLSCEDYTAIAGHVIDLTAGPTLEIFIQPFRDTLARRQNDATGLPLLDLGQ